MKLNEAAEAWIKAKIASEEAETTLEKAKELLIAELTVQNLNTVTIGENRILLVPSPRYEYDWKNYEQFLDEDTLKACATLSSTKLKEKLFNKFDDKDKAETIINEYRDLKTCSVSPRLFKAKDSKKYEAALAEALAVQAENNKKATKKIILN